jgi:threonine/homoserine efflux transporter RhtA
VVQDRFGGAHLRPVHKAVENHPRGHAKTRWLLVGLGVCLAVMKHRFYLALDRLP